MITRIRAALLCGTFESTDQGDNYIAVLGDTLWVDTNPGLAILWVSVHLELDGRHTIGRLEVHAEHLDQSIPLIEPAGREMIGVAYPIFVPVLKPGRLTVAIYNDGVREPVADFGWTLDFQPAAKRLGVEEGLRIRRAAAKHAEEVRARIAGANRPNPGSSTR